MVRFVFSLDNRALVDCQNLRDLAWLSVPDRVKFFKMAHLFRIHHKLAPSYLLPNFKLISVAHSHNTRGSSHNFHLSRELSLFSNGFAFTAIKEWNELPDSIKSIGEFRVFKRKLKQFFISRYVWLYWFLQTDFFWAMVWICQLFMILMIFILMNLILIDSVGKKSLDF